MEPEHTNITDTELHNTKPKRKLPMHKTKEIIRKIPQQKQHIEFISALLTVPVLITVLILNLHNLNTKPAAAPTPTPTITPVSPTPGKQKPTQTNASSVTSVASTGTLQPTADPNQCIKGIGPIDISYPSEGQTVSDNPVCINISYTADNYCAVVWAYKINNGPLSDYSNNSACLYNLPQGSNTFTLQVKSLVSNTNKTINRHFFYIPTVTPTPIISPTSSASSSGATQ